MWFCACVVREPNVVSVCVCGCVDREDSECIEFNKRVSISCTYTSMPRRYPHLERQERREPPPPLLLLPFALPTDMWWVRLLLQGRGLAFDEGEGREEEGAALAAGGVCCLYVCMCWKDGGWVSM